MTSKWSILTCRLHWIIYSYPKRLSRIYIHFNRINKYYIYRYAQNRWMKILLGIGDSVLLLSDLLLVGDVYNAMVDIVKKGRGLTKKEKDAVDQILGDSLRTDIIMIDEKARVGTKRLSAAYVSYNTINTASVIRMKLLMHELVHVWQYQNFGSIYLLHALVAQKSIHGYDYGGFENLYRLARSNADLHQFNFEQMAEIVEDFYYYGSKPEHQYYIPYRQYYRHFTDQMAIL